MARSIPRLRTLAAQQQQFHCYYCSLPMWDSDPHQFIAQYALTPKQARLLRCTAEHLHPRSEGGKDTKNNIVAACLYCNRTRHAAKVPLEPSQYQQRVRRLMRRGKWLAGIFRERLSALTSTGQACT